MASIHSYETQAGRRHVVRWREGTRHRGKTFLRKRDALAFQADVIRREQLGELWEEEAGTVGQFLDGWLDDYKLRVAESTHERAKHALAALPEDLRHRRLAELRPKQLKDAVNGIARRGAERQGEMALAKFKQALRDNLDLKFDRRLLDVDGPVSRADEAVFLDWEQIKFLASLMPNDAYNRLVYIACLTGLRRGELLALRWADVLFEEHRLKVGGGKTDAARRSVDLTLRCERLLRVHYGRAGCPPKSAPVFPNNQGGHHDGHNFYNRVFAPAAKAAELDGLNFHSLRHTYISLNCAAGGHPSVIAAQVGHKDGGALILRRYRHLFPNEGREAADRLEGYIRRNGA